MKYIQNMSRNEIYNYLVKTAKNALKLSIDKKSKELFKKELELINKIKHI